MVSDDDIAALLAEGETAQILASKLIRMALERGGKDNVTVMAANLSVEETAIFAPIAAAMVGDSDADYRDEYYNSYGGNIIEDEENPVSPYVNADANAYKKPVDKNKILKIAGISFAVIVAVVLAALIIKAVFGGKDKNDEITKNPATTVQPSYSFPEATTVDPLLSTTEELSTTELTTQEESTTKKPKPTQAPAEPVTEPSTNEVTEPSTDDTTEPSTEATQPSSEPSTEATPPTENNGGENGGNENPSQGGEQDNGSEHSDNSET